MRIANITKAAVIISSFSLAMGICPAVPVAHSLTGQATDNSRTVSGTTDTSACQLARPLEPTETLFENGGFGYVVLDGVAVVLSWPAAEDVSIPDRLGNLTVAAVAGRGVEASEIRAVSIPATVTTLAERLFYGLPFLESVEVDPGNPTYESRDGVLFEREGAVLICYPAGKPEERYVIPEGTRALADDAFHGCRALRSLTLTDFVESVGPMAISGCSFLEEILVTESNVAFETRDGVLFERNTSTLVRYPAGRPGAEYEVPAGTRFIGDCAFHMCPDLGLVTLPDGLTSIGTAAFAGCFTLEELRIPASVSSIGEFAFHGCPEGSIRADAGTYAYGWLEADAQNRSAVVGG